MKLVSMTTSGCLAAAVVACDALVLGTSRNMLAIAALLPLLLAGLTYALVQKPWAIIVFAAMGWLNVKVLYEVQVRQNGGLFTDADDKSMTLYLIYTLAVGGVGVLALMAARLGRTTRNTDAAH